jgi:hypothetical protein
MWYDKRIGLTILRSTVPNTSFPSLCVLSVLSTSRNPQVGRSDALIVPDDVHHVPGACVATSNDLWSTYGFADACHPPRDQPYTARVFVPSIWISLNRYRSRRYPQSDHHSPLGAILVSHRWFGTRRFRRRFNLNHFIPALSPDRFPTTTAT